MRSRFPRNKNELKAFLKEQLTGLVKALLFYGVVFLTLYFGYQLYLSQFIASWMLRDVAIEMLKAVIDVDGVLIGFVGVIAVYALSEVSGIVEKAQQVPQAWAKHKETIEGWRTNILWLLAGTVIALATSILYSLQSLSYVGRPETVPNSYFVYPLETMLLGIAGVVWIIRSAGSPLKS